jgi:hypothetical protein
MGRLPVGPENRLAEKGVFDTLRDDEDEKSRLGFALGIRADDDGGPILDATLAIIDIGANDLTEEGETHPASPLEPPVHLPDHQPKGRAMFPRPYLATSYAVSFAISFLWWTSLGVRGLSTTVNNQSRPGKGQLPEK